MRNISRQRTLYFRVFLRYKHHSFLRKLFEDYYLARNSSFMDAVNKQKADVFVFDR